MIADLLKTIYQEQELRWNHSQTGIIKLLPLLKEVEQLAGPSLRQVVYSCQLSKGHFLLRQGKPAEQVWILLSGVAREYSPGGQGLDSRDSISHFFLPGHFVSNYHSVLTHSPSEVNIQLISDAQVLRLSWKDIFKLEERFPLLIQLEKRLVDVSSEERKRHSHCLQCLTAEQYYYYLQKNQQMLSQLVGINDLASYLGISPSSLSRIRSKSDGHRGAE